MALPGVDSPEQMLAMLEQFARQGGDLDQVPGDLGELLRNVKKDKGQPTEEIATEEITPEPGFVVKTADSNGQKVFINICASNRVAAPGNWAHGQMPEQVVKALENVDNLTQQQAEALRFPLSLGQAKSDIDKKGEQCTVYDCIFNEDVIKQAAVFRPLKAFLIELAINWISQKVGDELDKKFKLPRMRYKGDTIEVQRIRVDRKPLVSEIREVPEEPTFPLVTKKVQPKQQQQQQPAAGMPTSTSAAGQQPVATSSRPAATGAGADAGKASASGAAAAGASGLQQIKHTVQLLGRPVEHVEVALELPSEAASTSNRWEGVHVGLCGSNVIVTAPGCEQLQVHLPFAVVSNGAKAKLDASKAQLLLKLKYLPLKELVAWMRQESPYSFGDLTFANESYLELEP